MSNRIILFRLTGVAAGKLINQANQVASAVQLTRSDYLQKGIYTMQFGFVLPRGDARTAANFCKEAEEAGWDGFFVWEPVWGIDAWVSLSAAAMVTQRIRLGTMITPVSRMRPWKLASEAATLDNLSCGRVILAVGLGAVDTGFAEFGEETDRKRRAELLDEGLEIIEGLWRGQPFTYQGKHYTIKECNFLPPPPPIQQPRIPIWVVGAWPRHKSIARAARYDGILPVKMALDGKFLELTPDDIRQIQTAITQQRPEAGHSTYNIVIEGLTPGGDRQQAIDHVAPWSEAGATWWIEAMWEDPQLDLVLERIRQGPPKG